MSSWIIPSTLTRVKFLQIFPVTYKWRFWTFCTTWSDEEACSLKSASTSILNSCSAENQVDTYSTRAKWRRKNDCKRNHDRRLEWRSTCLTISRILERDEGRRSEHDTISLHKTRLETYKSTQSHLSREGLGMTFPFKSPCFRKCEKYKTVSNRR